MSRRASLTTMGAAGAAPLPRPFHTRKGER